MHDVAIIGAGAAGMMAAIFAARSGSGSVVAFDGAKRIGAKILISGGGRCNVTHDVVSADDFNGGSRNAIAKVLRTFDVPDTVAFFRSIGVVLEREENGKLFPVTDRAATVLDALVSEVARSGARIAVATRVGAIEREGEAFRLDAGGEAVRARAVILATGGRSVPQTGSDGAGYELARALGHSVAPTFPALVPLLLPSGHWLTALSGVSLEAELAVVLPTGRVARRECGSMLLTHFGLSGPVVLDISRHWIAAVREHDAASLVANLAGCSFEQLQQRLIDAATATPRATLRGFFDAFLPSRLAEAVASRSAREGVTLGRMSREERKEAARNATALPLPVTGDRGWRFAEVTAGGIPLEEVNLRTMESRLVPRLFFCGEIVDVDGRIGGYNFQWAWASGRLAGMSAAAAVDSAAS